MRFEIPLVIEMTDDQVRAHATRYGLPCDGPGGMPMAKAMVDHVRAYTLIAVQDSPAFGEIRLGESARGADVTIKPRR